MEENINFLGNEVSVHKSAYLSLMGWPDIYSICFSQFDGDKDSFSLDGDKDSFSLNEDFLSLSLSD